MQLPVFRPLVFRFPSFVFQVFLRTDTRDPAGGGLGGKGVAAGDRCFVLRAGGGGGGGGAGSLERAQNTKKNTGSGEQTTGSREQNTGSGEQNTGSGERTTGAGSET